MSGRPLRIAVIAPLRYPIAQPHAGGLESALWNRVRFLRRAGHRVTLCAVDGSDFLAGSPRLFRMPVLRWPNPAAATDTTYPAGYLQRASDALQDALGYIERFSHRFDLVDNHCLDGMPLRWSDRIGLPMVTTLHTPVLDGLVDAHRFGSGRFNHFLAVSSHTAREWAGRGIRSSVMPNAIDTARWRLGPGGEDLVWFGRIVPEKGPHLAIDAARRAGRRIVLAGRVGDLDYATKEVWPRLGADARYVGPLRPPALARLVGSSACALVTPVWEEPFGLVIAEALATGTPVAAFDCGGIPEVVAGMAGTRLVPMGDTHALADAAADLIGRSTATTRERSRTDAIARYDLTTRGFEIEKHFRALVGSPAAAVPVLL